MFSQQQHTAKLIFLLLLWRRAQNASLCPSTLSGLNQEVNVTTEIKFHLVHRLPVASITRDFDFEVKRGLSPIVTRSR